MNKSFDLKEKPADFEKRIREYWEHNKIEKQSITARDGAEQFVFFEGPPTANGKPGIHHVISRTLKDAVCRYKTMKGFQVKRKAGWDTHGLPVEIEVEKKLGLSNKNDIEKYGIEKFNKECRESVFSYEREWREMTKTMGYWIDLDNPYITLDNKYIESIWWILKQFFDAGLIYKGHKIVPYCPSCGTPLSSHEVAQGYQDVEDPSVFVKFKAIDRENTYFLAWTTTPWTLISNVALVVNPNEMYVEVRVKTSEDRPQTSEHIILAKDRLSVLDGDYEIVKEYLGKDLEFTPYEQLFDYIKVEEKTSENRPQTSDIRPQTSDIRHQTSDIRPQTSDLRHQTSEGRTPPTPPCEGGQTEHRTPKTENRTPNTAFYICCGDYVSMSDGTGIVHTAPAFGQDDYSIGVKYKLPFMQPVDDAGRFVKEVTDYAGQFVKDADKGIIRNLKERGMLYKRTQIMHNYPFCWRCKSPLIYYARSTWYIKTSEFKQKMIENNAKVNWQPSFVGEKRFGEWLENNVDWALSRDRFWGTPLNIWKCEDCGEMVSIGSIAELREKGVMNDGSDVLENIELHRPYVDNILLDCPKCGKKISRTPEVIDCWFDSGSMPFAQWHYPFENADIFEKELFPADFICEGIDQTRGWFYTLLAISTFIKGCSPFKNVLVNDLILDKNGQKMSKSKGNTVDPMQLMKDYGADANRWYLLYVSPPWTPTKFDVKGVEEIYSKFIGTLKNVYSFYITYAQIDNFVASEHQTPNPENRTPNTELDRWIYSRLHTLIDQVSKYNEDYDFTRSLRAIQKFVIDELSNWYVRRSRRRYWAMTLTDDKKEAYLTLHQVLTTLAKLIAPFAPFIAEEIFTGLNIETMPSSPNTEVSVHLEQYPIADPTLIDKTLEKEMQTIIDLVTMGRAARNQAQIKVRQTLQALYVPQKHSAVVSRMTELIKEEINVKEIILLPEQNDLIKWQAKLNLKIAGPKFGKDIKTVSTFLETANTSTILQSFAEKKPYPLPLTPNPLSLEEEDVIISIAEKSGFTFENYGNDFVALDCRLTDDLIREGHARELVNKIQFTRKENNFDIMDRVKVIYCGNDTIKAVFAEFEDYIASETLTDDFESLSTPTSEMKMWDINGIEMHLAVKKNN